MRAHFPLVVAPVLAAKVARACAGGQRGVWDMDEADAHAVGLLARAKEVVHGQVTRVVPVDHEARCALGAEVEVGVVRAQHVRVQLCPRGLAADADDRVRVAVDLGGDQRAARRITDDARTSFLLGRQHTARARAHGGRTHTVQAMRPSASM